MFQFLRATPKAFLHFQQVRYIVLVGVAALWLSGCASTSLSPIRECDINNPRDTACRANATGTYVVKRGDTLRSIARTVGVDWKTLAALNGLQEPYSLSVNQVIKVSEQGRGSSVAVAPSNPATVVTCPLSGPRPAGCVSDAPSAPPPVVDPVVSDRWMWPVDGKVIEQFSERNTGIDIEAPEGTPVVAAADGVVKYADNKLRGYGNLIIIQHDAQYMSTYAHNKVMLVKENQRVKKGEKIAEVGKTDTVKPMLQFDIRKDTKAVDPMKYLPRK